MSTDEAMARDALAKWQDGPGPWVQFDHDNPAKVIDLATAEKMLKDWRKRNPAQFGYWLAAALTDTEPSKGARRKPAGGEAG